MTDARNRQPAGVPTGGEFAANTHDEAAALPAAPARVSVPGFISDEAIRKALYHMKSFSETGNEQDWDDARAAMPDLEEETFNELFAEYEDMRSEEQHGNGTPFDSGRFFDTAREMHLAFAAWDDSYTQPKWGARASEAKGKTTPEVNKMLRAEFKQAQASGYIPADLNISITANKGSGSRIVVSGIPEEARHRDFYPGETAQDTPERIRERPEFTELDRRLRAVASTFASSTGDRYSDSYTTWNDGTVVYDRA